MALAASAELEVNVIDIRPQHSDNATLRARLSGVAMLDRPIVADLRAAMQERERIVDLGSSKRIRRSRKRQDVPRIYDTTIL